LIIGVNWDTQFRKLLGPSNFLKEKDVKLGSWRAATELIDEEAIGGSIVLTKKL
jgi:hypothetical protein